MCDGVEEFKSTHVRMDVGRIGGQERGCEDLVLYRTMNGSGRRGESAWRHERRVGSSMRHALCFLNPMKTRIDIDMPSASPYHAPIDRRQSNP